MVCWIEAQNHNRAASSLGCNFSVPLTLYRRCRSRRDFETKQSTPGPRGTGKSCSAFAVAGVFNVDIYYVSVNDPDLVEGGFLSLLSHLSHLSRRSFTQDCLD